MVAQSVKGWFAVNRAQQFNGREDDFFLRHGPLVRIVIIRQVGQRFALRLIGAQTLANRGHRCGIELF